MNFRHYVSIFVLGALPIIFYKIVYVKTDKVNLEFVIDTIRSEAYYSERIDYVSDQNKAIEILYETKSLEKSLDYIIKKLGDHHSRIMNGGVARSQNKVLSELSMYKDIPVVKVNTWRGKDIQSSYELLYDNLRKAIGVSECGIIINNSENNGGNVWPMAAGLTSIMTNGVVASFLESNKNATKIRNVDGVLYRDDKVIPFIKFKENMKFDKKIAVIIGKKTASSGEILTIMLSGQINIKTFGQKTAGVPTSNKTYKMPNGSFLVLTTAITLDRNENKYSERITPDYLTENPLEEAKKWIEKECIKI